MEDTAAVWMRTAYLAAICLVTVAFFGPVLIIPAIALGLLGAIAVGVWRIAGRR